MYRTPRKVISGGGLGDLNRNSGYVIIGGASFRVDVDEVEDAGLDDGEVVDWD